MIRKKIPNEVMARAVRLYAEYGTQDAAAAVAGVSRNTFKDWLKEAKRQGIQADAPKGAAPDAKQAIRNLILKHPTKLKDIVGSVKMGVGEVLDVIESLKAEGVNIVRDGESFLVSKSVAASWIQGEAVEIFSRKDNTFLFGACGDNHVGSKYHREDVTHDLYRRYTENDVQAVFNTGNWIDGEARFNTYDIVAHGIDAQARLLAEIHPKVKFPTYAVWGDDHEGWYAQRDGIDVGRYVEGIMRSEGHNWHDLGFMEAHVKLTNSNSGKSCILSVVHPGGGSSYAVSYRPQKIIESLEGGEKPAVLLLGHYHKLDAGITRNVFYAQTGCGMDQSPFMRKKSIEAHVGGTQIALEQDPETGSITGFTPSLWRYFNRAYYFKEAKGNNRWSTSKNVTKAPRSVLA